MRGVGKSASGNAATRFGIREMGRFLVPLESPAGCFREGLCRVDVFMPSSWLFGGVEISTLVCDCFRTESDGERGGRLGVAELGRCGEGALIVDGDGPGGPSHVFDPAECRSCYRLGGATSRTNAPRSSLMTRIEKRLTDSSSLVLSDA